MGFKAALDMVSEAARTTIQSIARPAGPVVDEDVILGRMVKYKELFGAPPVQGGTSGGMVEQVTQLGTLIDIVEKIRGKGGSEADWKATLVDKGLDHIPELVEFGKSILGQRTREAEMGLRREEARRASLATIAQLQARGGAPPVPGQPPPGAPSSVSTAPPRTGPVPDGGLEPSPLHVVPIPVDSSIEVMPAEVSTASEEEINQRFVKQTIVRLVREGDDPASILDFIDRSMPFAGRYLTGLKEQKVREFLQADEILREVTTFPHYEQFLKAFMEVLSEEATDDEPSDSPARAN
jgi:hypothetical protein